MLADRLALIEKEISVLQKECADLYYQIAIGGDISLSALYENRQMSLSTLRADLEAVKYLIMSGREYRKE